MRIQAVRLLSVVAFWAVYSCFGSYYEPTDRLLLTFAAMRGGSTEEATAIPGSGSILSSILYEHNETKQSELATNAESLSEESTLGDDDAAAADAEINTSQRRQKFLDRVRLLSRSLILGERDAVLDEEETNNEDDEAITPQSDLMRPGRHMTIVTTAALPWMTGTSVNPLLRAAHLARMTRRINAQTDNTTQWVTLVIPWLELEQDRDLLYHNHNFTTQEEQEAYLRDWLAKEADMPDAAHAQTGLRILFYPARYHSDLKSIFAMGDITSLIPDDRADVCILEEPEHLNWYRAPGTGWSKKFHYVVGIVHTNYKDYAWSQYHGLWSAPALAIISSAMVRAYCHKVIKLSDVLQTFATEKESTSNVHGVRSDFLKEGMRRAAAAAQDGQTLTERKAYFVGKLIWQKGFDILLDLQDYYKQSTGEYFPIDIYGSGPDLKDISRAYLGRRREEKPRNVVEVMADKTKDKTVHATISAETLNTKASKRLEKIKQMDFELPKTFHELRRQPIPATFPGREDHAMLTEKYSIFVNPSVSEVLCTTTAEALAMGKFVIIPVHPSNTFFLKFPNCLPYRNKFEFVANLRWAMTHDPEPLTPELAREFAWEAATERLVAASAITHKEARERESLGLSKRDERIAWFHHELGKGERGDAIRKVLGAGPASHQVKYQKQRDDESDDDDEDDGFSRKLFGSQIGEALRTTLANGLPTLIGGGSA